MYINCCKLECCILFIVLLKICYGLQYGNFSFHLFFSIDRHNSNGRNHVITRDMYRNENRSNWKINGKASSMKEVQYTYVYMKKVFVDIGPLFSFFFGQNFLSIFKTMFTNFFFVPIGSRTNQNAECANWQPLSVPPTGTCMNMNLNTVCLKMLSSWAL